MELASLVVDRLNLLLVLVLNLEVGLKSYLGLSHLILERVQLILLLDQLGFEDLALVFN